jgi:hypothetical protein
MTQERRPDLIRLFQAGEELSPKWGYSFTGMIGNDPDPVSPQAVIAGNRTAYAADFRQQ